MFKKFKDRLNEVSEEVKKDPRFQNSLASVNKLAQDTLSTLNREKSGSRESLQSTTSQEKFGNSHPTGNNNLLSNDQFFSLADDEDSVLTPPPLDSSNDATLSPIEMSTPTKSGFEPVELGHPNGTRARRSSSGSMTTEASTLFPIYESPQQVFSLPSATDLDSTAGSEWEDGNSSAQLAAISKEQMFQMLQKMRSRYHKYKGRYADVAKAYTELESENSKIKNIMQQTQVK